MEIKNLPLPNFFKEFYNKFPKLTPIQAKTVDAGLLQNESIIACAPTASGKTLVATMAIANTLGKGKSIYLVPLKALANEKYKEYKNFLEKTDYSVGIAVGDIDSPQEHLSNKDLLILTTEKLDSLLRHHVPWLSEVKTVIIDEIHLLNDNTRGPTLEVVLTILKTIISPQLVGLSATIGNPEALAEWLDAKLVQDNWRPVKLKKGIHVTQTEFFA